MSHASGHFSGWTLAETLERCADPDLLDQCFEAKAAWRALGAPRRFILSPGIGPELQGASERGRIGRVAYKKFQAAGRHIWGDIELQLAEARLFSNGSFGGPSRPQTPILPDGWRDISVRDGQRSVARERVGERTEIYNIRVFPLVHYRDATKLLAGCSLREAFRKCVLDDPEVLAWGKRVLRHHQHRELFGEGRYPGLSGDFKWPLGLTALELASRIQSPVRVLATQPRPSEEIERAAAAITDRWNALVGLFASAEVGTQGTFVATGEVKGLDRFLWGRTGPWIDVQNGDFFEVQDNKLVLRWTGISLTPASRSAGKDAPIARVPTSRREGRKSQELREAFQKAGIDLAKDDRSLKELAAAVIPYLRDRPETAHQLDALAKRIGRLRNSTRHQS